FETILARGDEEPVRLRVRLEARHRSSAALLLGLEEVLEARRDLLGAARLELIRAHTNSARRAGAIELLRERRDGGEDRLRPAQDERAVIAENRDREALAVPIGFDPMTEKLRDRRAHRRRRAVLELDDPRRGAARRRIVELLDDRLEGREIGRRRAKDETVRRLVGKDEHVPSGCGPVLRLAPEDLRDRRRELLRARRREIEDARLTRDPRRP